MPSYVTLEKAKRQLRVTHDDENLTIDELIDTASGVIADYLKSGADDSWTPTTVPAPVEAATLLLLAHMYRHRGDDDMPSPNPWPIIETLLMRRRDPAVA